MSLIVTGSIGIDTVETPGQHASDVLGGSSIYFAAASSFFGDVRLVGAVGDDFPDSFLETFRHFEVDLLGLERRAGSKTFRWHGRYLDDMNQRETLQVHLNVLAEALPPVPEAYRSSEYVFLATTNPANQIKLLEQFPKRKLVMADTIDLYIQTERDGFLDMIRRIDGLIINDNEAEMLTEESDLVKAAGAILEMGPKFVVIKKGQHGAMLRHEHGWAVLPAFPSNRVVDPTGAGDAFAGGMMGHLAGSGDLSLSGLRKAMAYGTITASYTIESFSVTRLCEITRKDIDARFDAFRAMLGA